MKKFFLTFISLFAAFTGFSQMETTGIIQGAVIDKNGNPLPGALVKASGGAETVLVESDGSFVLEVPIWLKSATASYPGLRSSTKKVDFTKPMIFKLSSQNKGKFINITVGPTVSLNSGDASAVFALMGGTLNNWGWYAKLGAGIGEEWQYGIQAVAGVTKHIFKSMYGFFGLGYGGYFNENKVWHITHYDYFGSQWWRGAAIDGGLIWRTGSHFNIGYNLTVNTDFKAGSITNSISLGYVW